MFGFLDRTGIWTTGGQTYTFKSIIQVSRKYFFGICSLIDYLTHRTEWYTIQRIFKVSLLFWG